MLTTSSSLTRESLYVITTVGSVLSTSNVSLLVTSTARNAFNAKSVVVIAIDAIPLFASPAGIVAAYVQTVESEPMVILVAETSLSVPA